MESILVNLIDHLSRELPWARTIDEDYGQLEALDDENIDMYPLTFPAILIDLPGTDWSDYDDTHGGSNTVDQIMQREEKRKALHTLLQGYRANDKGALIRTRSKFFTFNHGIKVYEENYTCAISEATRETLKVERKKLKVVLKS